MNKTDTKQLSDLLDKFCKEKSISNIHISFQRRGNTMITEYDKE